MKKFPGDRYLNFRCTGCGNCCKDPLLPLTDDDIRRIAERTGDPVSVIAQVVDRHAIDMADEPEAFASLRQGKRVLVLRHERGRCRYLGDDDRCTIYTSRPLGCRLYPLDPVFTAKKKLRRLTLVQATPCPYEMNGSTDVPSLYELQQSYWAQHTSFNTKVAEWNRLQRRRKRAGRAAQTAREFFSFLGLDDFNGDKPTKAALNGKTPSKARPKRTNGATQKAEPHTR